MGDLPPGTAPPSLDITAAGLPHDEHHGPSNPSASSMRSPSGNAPFYSQISSIPPGQVRPDIRSPAHATSPHYGGQEHGGGALNMASMMGALPDYGAGDSATNLQSQQGQRPLSGASTSALVYQLQQNLQIPGHTPGSVPALSPYGAPYGHGQFQQNFIPAQGQLHQNYPAYPSSQHRPPAPSSMQPQYQNFPQPSHYLYYPSLYGAQGQYAPQGYQTAQAVQNQALYGRRPSFSSSQQGQNVEQLPQHEGGYSPISRHFGGSQADAGPVSMLSGGLLPQSLPTRPGPASLIPRGPPRKPKQSGHALWVGNLPPGTTVLQLKDHFSRDATKDIESLFLISKSNCAFVNYRTEASCTAAMHRFHDSRFNGVRLVCRLRRSSAPTSGVPTGPAAMVGTSQPANTSPPHSPALADGEEPAAEGIELPGRQSGEEDRQGSTASVKYFIVKSLTLQDLELSVRNGIWATQSHNEEVLNKAYRSAEHVYLIFSANKSGEYFGYARMASPILEDATPFASSAPQPGNILDSPDVPKSIPTPATEFAPRGRIIDDSARGTIFWEAELSDSENEEVNNDKVEQVDSEAVAMEGDASVAQSWGKPFKVEWVSTNRLPFYRTRGLRNPWNANREVKIARDGTELETSVGERLVQMFHRLGPSTSAMVQPQQLGLPPMRPF